MSTGATIITANELSAAPLLPFIYLPIIAPRFIFDARNGTPVSVTAVDETPVVAFQLELPGSKGRRSAVNYLERYD